MAGEVRPGFSCPQCGKRTEPRDRTCPSCGARLAARVPRRDYGSRFAAYRELPGELRVVLGCSGCVGVNYLMSLVVFLFLIPAAARKSESDFLSFVFFGLAIPFGVLAWGYGLGVWVLATVVASAFTTIMFLGALSPGPTPNFAESRFA